MNNGPKLWNKLLNESPANAVLMGGAVIDWHLGHEAKDYDIFFEYKPGPPGVPENWELTEADFNDPVWAEAHQQEYLQGVGEDGNNKIGSVNEYIVDGEHRVQLIGVMYKDPKMHFQNFDHSLTLGRYTKTGLFIHRRVFDSIRSHIVTYISKNHEPKAVERSFNRAKAKTKRYSGGHEGNWNFHNFVAIGKKKLDPFDF